MGRPIVAATLVLALATGCREGLAFRQDGQLAITHPSDRAAVTVPFEVRWEATDLPDGVRFALLVDRPPPPPGEDLGWLSRHDPACTATVDCTTRSHLGALRVEVTDRPVAVLTSLPRPTRPGAALHEVTVIVLDDAGRRLGESVGAITVEGDRGR